MNQDIKIIKDTIPNEFHTESGELHYSYNCDFLDPIIENDKLLFTIQPFMQIHIDNKLFGELRCESDFFIDKTLKGEILFQKICECLEKNAINFNEKISEQKIMLPENFQFKNPPLDQRKEFFMNLFSNFS